MLKNTFSNVVSDYEFARPTYPQELFNKIQEFSAINGSSSILEVGAGTGQATDLFLKNNVSSIDLLEVSEEQVIFLHNKYAELNDIRILRSYFEEFEKCDANKSYDLIYSATAFHWIECEVGYPKAWSMLKSGGALAVFWQMSSVTYYHSETFVGLNKIKKKYLPEESLGYDENGIREIKERRIKQIQAGGCFHEPEFYEFRWVDTYDANRYTALINTYSSTQLLDQDIRKAYLNDVKEYIIAIGGNVEVPQLVMLYLVRK